MRLPPYGKILKAYQDENLRHESILWIYTGKQASQSARHEMQWGSNLATYLPYGENFLSYTWPVKNQKTILVDSGFITLNHLKQFAVHLLQSEPRLLAIHSTPHQYVNVLCDKENLYGKNS